MKRIDACFRGNCTAREARTTDGGGRWASGNQSDAVTAQSTPRKLTLGGGTPFPLCIRVHRIFSTGIPPARRLFGTTSTMRGQQTLRCGTSVTRTRWIARTQGKGCRRRHRVARPPVRRSGRSECCDDGAICHSTCSSTLTYAPGTGRS